LDYQQSLDYLYNLINYEKTTFTYDDLKLDRMRELVKRLGNPQYSFPVALVAGSKGKGSTAYLLERMLAFTGISTGLFVKPHLFCFRERIRANGSLISPAELAAFMSRLQPVIESMGRESSLGKPTYFEVSVALALCFFADLKVDRVVLEVGLGGRLDATNVVDPSLTVITPISLDHTEILGDTLSLIAGEKAGILRSGIPLVLAEQAEEAERVFSDFARSLRVPVVSVAQESAYHIISRTWKGSHFTWRVRDGEWRKTFLPLVGDQQVGNFLTAVLAAQQWGISLSPDQGFQEELERVSWPGRASLIATDPPVVFDVAHNQASFAFLCRSLREYFGFGRVIFLLGFLEGKDYAGVGKEVQDFGGTVFLTSALNPKTANPSNLHQYFTGDTTRVHIVKEPFAAKEQALEKARKEKIPLVVAGSFYLAKLFYESMNLGMQKEELELC